MSFIPEQVFDAKPATGKGSTMKRKKAKKQDSLLGDDLQKRKIHPKLRMIADGDLTVNTARAEFTSALKITAKTFLKEGRRRERAESPEEWKRKKLPPRGSVAKLSPEVLVNVFVYAADRADSKTLGIPVTAKQKNLATATVPLHDLPKLAKKAEVRYVEIGAPLAAPQPTIESSHVPAPSPGLRRFPSPPKVKDHHYGEDVIIGIIDVQGFDFAHPDFLDAKGKTRFVRIWDQGGTVRPNPKKRNKKEKRSRAHLFAPFGYGSEIWDTDMNAAIKDAPSVGAPPQSLESQSQMVPGSHATHVASIAAGNKGVCRNSWIAAVLLSLPQENLIDRREAFYDTTRLAQAVDYLLAVAEGQGKPISINISLGTNGHAHDGASAINRWIDAALALPGRCVTVAAGNAGQERSLFEGDWGFVMGRIHTSGQVPAAELTKDLEWVIFGNGNFDLSENELELWFSPQDRLEISLKPPNSHDWIGPVFPRQYIENQRLRDGTFVSIYNELYHPMNGCNYAALYISPNLKTNPPIGVPAGTWTVRLRGQQIRDGRFHGWIERDDPRRVGKIGDRDAWVFPSFFSERSNVDNSSVSSLACGNRVVAVANLDEPHARVNLTSSQGPTRDGREKPDIAAPGTEIVAAKGFAGPEDPWVAMSGTSMASPFVTGVVGLMLAVEPKLTAAQIVGILHRTAKPLPGATFSWKDDSGYGQIQPDLCLQEAALINEKEDITS
jgi:subtilisin family serine protease